MIEQLRAEMHSSVFHTQVEVGFGLVLLSIAALVIFISATKKGQVHWLRLGVPLGAISLYVIWSALR